MKLLSILSSLKMSCRWRLFVSLAASLAPLAAFAAAIGPGDFSSTAGLINFDNLAGGSSIFTGEVVTNQYSSLGVTFVNPNFVSRANANLAAMLDGQSDPNVLFIQQHNGSTSGLPQEILFSTPMLRVGAFFATSLDSTITLTAFSPAGVKVESLTLTGGFNAPDFLTGFVGLEEPDGIGRIELFSRSNDPAAVTFNFSIDDLRFEAVPEPATWTLAALGLGFGAILNRKHRVAGTLASASPPNNPNRSQNL